MKIGMLTAGGDCPGLNAVIRAVTRSAIYRGRPNSRLRRRLPRELRRRRPRLPRLRNFDFVAIHVGLDLPPQGRARSAPAQPNAYGNSHLGKQREGIPQAERHALEDGADDVSPGVRRGQSDQGGARIGIEMRGAFAHQVRGPEQAVGAGAMRRPRRSGARRDRVVFAGAAPKVSRNQRSERPAAWVTPMTCQRPGIAWQKVCSLPLGSSDGRSVAAKTTPEVPMVALTAPGAAMPMPIAPAA